MNLGRSDANESFLVMIFSFSKEVIFVKMDKAKALFIALRHTPTTRGYLCILPPAHLLKFIENYLIFTKLMISRVYNIILI